MVPPDTNPSPSFAGQPVRVGGRKPTASSCRDEVLAALYAQSARTGSQAFNVREVFAEMLDRGTLYAEPTVFKTVQRMKATPLRPPYARLERVGTKAFRS